MPAEAPRPERDEMLRRMPTSWSNWRSWLNGVVREGEGRSYEHQSARLDAHAADLEKWTDAILARFAQAERRIAELDHECQASMAEIARGRERAEEAERLAVERLDALRLAARDYLAARHRIYSGPGMVSEALLPFHVAKSDLVQAALTAAAEGTGGRSD